MLQRFQRSEEELRRVAGEWLECQKRIDAYVDEQVRAAASPRGPRLPRRGVACGSLWSLGGCRVLSFLEAFTEHPARQSLGCTDEQSPRHPLSLCPEPAGKGVQTQTDGRVGQVTFGVVEDREAGPLC